MKFRGINRVSQLLEEQTFCLYSQFDKDKNNALDMRECLEMIDALFRSTFILEGLGNPPATAAWRATSLAGTMIRVKDF